MPLSAHMESGHHIRNHGTASLEHRSSPACRSSSSSLPFGNRHCNSSFDFKYPSLNNNQICSKVMRSSVDRSFNSKLHVVTTSSNAPYSDSPVISVSTSAEYKSSGSDSLTVQSQANSSPQENNEVCTNSSEKMPSRTASPITVSLNQSRCDSPNINEDSILAQNTTVSSEEIYDEVPPILLSKSSDNDSSIGNESEQKSSTDDAITEKSLSSEPQHNNIDALSEINYDDTDTSHFSSKMEDSSLSENQLSPNNKDSTSLDNTIETVLDKIRTGRGTDVELGLKLRSNESSQDISNSEIQQFYPPSSINQATAKTISSTEHWSQYKQSSPKESCRDDSNFKYVNKNPVNVTMQPNSSQLNVNDPRCRNPSITRNMNIPFSSFPRNQLAQNASRMPYNMFNQNSMYPHQSMQPVNQPNLPPNYNLPPNHFPNNSYQGTQNINFNQSGYYHPSFVPPSRGTFYPQRGYERMVGPSASNAPNNYLPKQSIPRQTFPNAHFDIYKNYGINPALYQYNHHQTRPIHSMPAYDTNSTSMQMFPPGYYSNYPMDSNCVKPLSHPTLKPTSRKRSTVAEKGNKLPPQMKRRKTDDLIDSDENILETIYDKLLLPNFQKCIQEPLVQPHLFLAIPKGGHYSSKNDVDEVEESSQFILDKKKKYDLTPYSLKLCQSNCSPNNDSFVFQSMKTCGNLLKLPTKPIFSKSLERSSTPDQLVCASPFNSDHYMESISSIPSLKAFESEPMEHSQSRSATPILPVHTSQNIKEKSISCTGFPNRSDNELSEKSLLELSNSSVEANSNFECKSLKNEATEIKIFPYDSFFNGFCNAHDLSSTPLKPIGGYAEQSTSIPKLLKNMPVAKCEVCNSNIVDWQYVRRKDESSENGVGERLFCSVLCLTTYVKRCQPSFFEPNEHDFSSEFVQELNIDSLSILSRILIKGPLPKTFKKPTKRIFERQLTVSCRDNSINKKWKELRYKRFKKSIFPLKNGKMSDNPEDILRASPSLKVSSGGIKDGRVCCLCQRTGDMSESTAGRLINHDVDEWFHVNCALWCYEVYETISGALVDPNDTSYTRAKNTKCHHCGEYGAGLPCYKSRCTCIYHVPCAQEAGCMFFTDRGMYCPVHRLAPDHPLHMPDISANRKIFLDRESNIVLGNALLNYQNLKSRVIRSGSLIACCIGHLTPEDMLSGNFNDNTSICPVGYKILRIFWSTVEINKRCLYECSINAKNQRPIFIVRRLEKDGISEENAADTPDLAWQPFLWKISALREKAKLIKLYPHLLKGKDLFGLVDPSIIRACESLPNIEILPNYIFRYGRLQSLNDNESHHQFCLSGTARLENRHTIELCHRSSRWARSRFAAPTNVDILQSSSTGRQNSMNTHVDYGAPHSKINKLQLFKRLTSGYEWKSNVYFAPSKSSGMGVFAARSMEKHTMIIELVGELLREQVALKRETVYRSKHRRNIILMRIQKDLVLDATCRGNLSRFIRHSCNPNCVAELLIIDGKPHIVLTAGRAIPVTEELTFDYKVDQYAVENNWQFPEPYQGPPKIPCFCGASTCKKWIS